jgi:branched-chain amino acid transport system ATP-binding protein
MTNMTDILEIKGVSKRFGGLRALDAVTIGVKPGTIHGIIGPNGAGKTTLFNVITGLIQPDEGNLYVEGRMINALKPHQLVPRGVARTFQNIRLFKEMSVIENVLIGQHVHTPTPIFSILINGKKARRGEEAALREARDALRFFGLETKADEQVTNLSYGQQRLVEFARALAAKPRLILLDEPAAGMNPTEKANLLRLVCLLQEKGYTIVLIEHDMKLVMNICTAISVLDHGKKIAEGKPEYIRKHPDVISAYLGKGDASHAGG